MGELIYLTLHLLIIYVYKYYYDHYGESSRLFQDLICCCSKYEL